MKNPLCPLCNSIMATALEMYGQFGPNAYARVMTRLSCSNDECRFVERMVAKTEDTDTIEWLQSLIVSFHGEKINIFGKFNKGGVKIDRRKKI